MITNKKNYHLPQKLIGLRHTYISADMKDVFNLYEH